MRARILALLGVVALMVTTAAYPPAKPTVAVLAGELSSCGRITVQVSGFAAGESVLIVLGAASSTVTVDGTGRGSVEISEPAVSGPVTLSATGQSSGRGTTSSLQLIRCLVDAGGPTTTTSPTSTTSSVSAPTTTRVLVGPQIPATGARLSGAVRIGAVVLAAGLVLALVARRVRPA